jgi:(E)-4-hydroxy-3-methylbut-2-enyl-diphosphate synthase
LVLKRGFNLFFICDIFELMIRRETREVIVGSVKLGKDHPVAVQTMWDRPVTDIESTVGQLFELAAAGCDIIRFTVPDEHALPMIRQITERSPMPVVADIHFDYKMAIAALEAGCAKIRINPGNIGARWKVEEVIDRAADAGAAIRIGLNGGSLPSAHRKRDDHVISMLEVITEYLEVFEQKQFSNLVVSLKDSDIDSCYRVNHEFAKITDIPLHLGVTEAGPLIPSVVKSTLVLGKLLQEGIGDTIRVSITGDIFDEVAAAKEILRSCGRSRGGVQLVACPKCGRATFDTHAFTASVERELQKIKVPVTVAIMGCVVNGPGEAKMADLGITGAAGEILLFKRGKILKKVAPEQAREVFLEELKAVIDEISHD